MSAQLDVTYTPQYEGCHRICFRTTEIEYCCYLDTTASVVGTPKTTSIILDDYIDCLVSIPIEISCQGITAVTGYIQPCCSDENSNSNRVAFTASYESTECNSYLIECTKSGIGEITINNPGYGWPIGVTPNILINDGLSIGSGFSGIATMSCLPGDNFCSIDGVVINDAGQGYYSLSSLAVSVDIPPTCISNELIVDGNFSNGLNDWNVVPAGGWYMIGSDARYQVTFLSSGAEIRQNILTPGKVYNISIDNAQVGSNVGPVRLIITAGLFSGTGTASNQYMITRNPGDPLFNLAINITLTCFGSNVFSIYADCTSGDAANRVQVTGVSVVEECTAIIPELEVTSLDDCGNITIPNCNGTPSPTNYSILSGSEYIINVCSGNGGPSPENVDEYVIQAATISCCDCKLYQVLVNTSLDIYYTSCNQTIDVITVPTGSQGVTVCAVEGSVWPVNKIDNLEIISITEVGTCIPNQ